MNINGKENIMNDRTILEIYTDSAQETELCGAQLARLMLDTSDLPRFVALDGDLGAGKTAFTRGFCSVVCPGAAVRSPTYALVNEYRGKPDVFHFDVYRITDEDDLYSTGFFDYFERGGIILCEWAVNIPYALPEKYISAVIEKLGDDKRKITISEKTNADFIS